MAKGYNRGYTLFVKTAISIPDPVFEEAERLAEQLGVSRSRLYSEAVSEYLVRRVSEGVTERLNTIYDEVDAELSSEIELDGSFSHVAVRP